MYILWMTFVKVVKPDQHVDFIATPLLGTDTQGFWIAKLPDDLPLISVGQGYVNAGDKVTVSMAGDGAAP